MAIITDPPRPEILHTITAQEFIDAVTGIKIPEEEWFCKKSYSNTLEDAVLDPKLAGNELKGDFIILNNTRITDFIKLSNLSLRTSFTGFIFNDCEIQGFYIDHCQTGDWKFHNSAVGDFIAHDSTVRHIHYLQKSFGKSIELADIMVEHIRIGNSYCKSIYLKPRCYCYGLSVYQESLVESLTFSMSIADYFHTYDNSKIIRMGISRSVMQHLHFDYESTCNELKISDSFCADKTFSDTSIHHLTITCSSGSLTLNSADVSQVNIKDCHFHIVEWKESTKGAMLITDCCINQLKLWNTILPKDASVSINRSKIHVVQLDELVVQGQLILRGVSRLKAPMGWPEETDRHHHPALFPLADRKELSDTRMQDFWDTNRAPYLEKLERFNSKFSEAPLFQITNSSMGKTEIISSDLRSFTFLYRDSKLLEIFISGSVLPKDNIKIHQVSSDDSREAYEQKVFFYNQLKKIFDNQGSILDAAWYHSQSMKCQEGLTRFYGNMHASGNKKRWYQLNNWLEIQAFRLNRRSNNHGENWRRGIGFLVVGSLFFYSLYYITLFHDQQFAFSRALHFFADYLSFLDPLHKLDFLVPKETLHPIAKIIDFAGRMFTAYAVYQFITAFRKHSRKSGA